MTKLQSELNFLNILMNTS